MYIAELNCCQLQSPGVSREHEYYFEMRPISRRLAAVYGTRHHVLFVYLVWNMQYWKYKIGHFKLFNFQPKFWDCVRLYCESSAQCFESEVKAHHKIFLREKTKRLLSWGYKTSVKVVFLFVLASLYLFLFLFISSTIFFRLPLTAYLSNSEHWVLLS